MIDVNFDFTADMPHYWDGYWHDGLLGYSRHDPDRESKTLREYHGKLWSKKLPNGREMNLRGGSADYLMWGDFRLGSDSILASFRYKRNREFIRRVADSVPDWKGYVETFVRKSYTIGGSIIFPKMRSSINQVRGFNKYIRDRWDLTLECIRKFYLDYGICANPNCTVFRVSFIYN